MFTLVWLFSDTVSANIKYADLIHKKETITKPSILNSGVCRGYRFQSKVEEIVVYKVLYLDKGDCAVADKHILAEYAFRDKLLHLVISALNQKELLESGSESLGLIKLDRFEVGLFEFSVFSERNQKRFNHSFVITGQEITTYKKREIME